MHISDAAHVIPQTEHVTYMPWDKIELAPSTKLNWQSNFSTKSYARSFCNRYMFALVAIKKG